MQLLIDNDALNLGLFAISWTLLIGLSASDFTPYPPVQFLGCPVFGVYLSEIAATATMAMLAYAGDLRGRMRRECLG